MCYCTEAGTCSYHFDVIAGLYNRLENAEANDVLVTRVRLRAELGVWGWRADAVYLMRAEASR
jgi:hypothetical protein